MGFMPSQGTWRVTSSHRMTPKLYTSALEPPEHKGRRMQSRSSEQWPGMAGCKYNLMCTTMHLYSGDLQS